MYGGGGKYKKRNSCTGNQVKNSCMQSRPGVHNILTKKKYSFKGHIKEKKFMLLENSPRPP